MEENSAENPEENPDPQSFTVQEITGCKQVEGDLYYEVVWEDDSASWKPFTGICPNGLAMCQEKIRAFHEAVSPNYERKKGKSQIFLIF